MTNWKQAIDDLRRIEDENKRLALEWQQRSLDADVISKRHQSIMNTAAQARIRLEELAEPDSIQEVPL